MTLADVQMVKKVLDQDPPIAKAVPTSMPAIAIPMISLLSSRLLLKRNMRADGLSSGGVIDKAVWGVDAEVPCDCVGA